MKPLLTVFSITNGRSTHKYSLNSLLESDYVGEIYVIKNMTWREALSTCIRKCHTPYFIRVDDDFSLHPKALMYMKENTLKLQENVGMIYWWLWEDFSNKSIDAIKIYKKEALLSIGGFQFGKDGKTDTTTNALLLKKGWKFIQDRSSIAIHMTGTYDEQIQYNNIWRENAPVTHKYKKRGYTEMLRYDKGIKYQYELRTKFLEDLNRKNNTLFWKWLKNENYID